MATIVTRVGKGSPLSFIEADANFTNLNTDKEETIDNLPLDTVMSQSADYIAFYDTASTSTKDNGDPLPTLVTIVAILTPMN